MIRISSSFYFNHKKRVYRLLRKIIGYDHSSNDEFIFVGPSHKGLDFQFDCSLICIYDLMLIANLSKFKEKAESRKIRTVEDLFSNSL